MGFERLDKLISNRIPVSRKEAHAFIRDGLVRVNGITANAKDQKIGSNDSVTVNGKELCREQFVYIMLNKPGGVVSASRDKKVKTVVDLIPQEMRRKNLFPAGRLDKDTEGFVLITNDGEFAHNILSPKNHVPKTYRATLDGRVTKEVIEKFRQGVTLTGGETCSPAGLSILDEEGFLAEIVLTEGKYHQIKRMFGANGLKVLSLKRLKIGNIELDPDVKPGACRFLTSKEVQSLRKTE